MMVCVNRINQGNHFNFSINHNQGNQNRQKQRKTWTRVCVRVEWITFGPGFPGGPRVPGGPEGPLSQTNKIIYQ